MKRRTRLGLAALLCAAIAGCANRELAARDTLAKPSHDRSSA